MTNLKEKKEIVIDGWLKFKLLISYLAVLGLGVISVFIFIYGLKDNEKYKFVYNEDTNVDYKVYLKENDSFDEPYLKSGGKYISSLIDKILVNFDYKMSTEELIEGNYNYSIVARLEALEKGKNVVIWSKEETLYDSEQSNISNSKAFDLSTQAEVDFDKYNMIINDFKRTNGVSIDGELTVSLVVNSNLQIDVTDKVIPNISKASIKIPLMETIIGIDTDYKPTNSITNTIDIKSDNNLHMILIASGIVSFVLFIYLTIVLIRYTAMLIKNQDKYGQILQKIFRDYDSIIVSVDSLPDIKGKDLLKVNDFNEILDAQTGLQEPILYYKSVRKKRSYFYVIKEDRVFMYVIKSKDFVKKEDKDDKKKEEV